jgi:hypothetical protein
MRRSRGRRSIGVGVVVVVAVTTLLTGVSVGDPGTPQDPAASPTPGTATIPTIPCPGPAPDSLVPSQVGTRYDLNPLWSAGHTGQGVQVALIEIGTSVDEGYLAAYQ